MVLTSPFNVERVLAAPPAVFQSSRAGSFILAPLLNRGFSVHRVSEASVGQVCWCDRLAMVPDPCPILTIKMEGECKPWCPQPLHSVTAPPVPSCPIKILDLAPLHGDGSFMPQGI